MERWCFAVIGSDEGLGVTVGKVEVLKVEILEERE